MQDAINHSDKVVHWSHKIDKIVCFGLRSLRRRAPGDREAEKEFREQIARHAIVAVFVQRLYSMFRDMPEVHVQLDKPYLKPQYKLEGVSNFAELRPRYSNMPGHDRESVLFITRESPFGLTEIDNSTFVISFSPGFNVRQILGDLAKTGVYPAGILCQKLKHEGHKDPPGDTLMRLMTGYEDWFHHPFKFGPWITNTYMNFHFRHDYNVEYEKGYDSGLELYRLPGQFQIPTRDIYDAHHIREQFGWDDFSPQDNYVESSTNSLLDPNTPRPPPCSPFRE